MVATIDVTIDGPATGALSTLASFGLQAIRRSVVRAARRRRLAPSGSMDGAPRDAGNRQGTCTMPLRRGLTSLVPAWKRSRSSLASKGNDSHAGEQCRPERCEETSEECRINAEPAAEADDGVPDNR